MARDKHRLEQRNLLINADYRKLATKQIGGKRLYTYEAILVMLADKYFLAPDTIATILQRHTVAV